MPLCPLQTGWQTVLHWPPPRRRAFQWPARCCAPGRHVTDTYSRPEHSAPARSPHSGAVRHSEVLAVAFRIPVIQPRSHIVDQQVGKGIERLIGQGSDRRITRRQRRLVTNRAPDLVEHPAAISNRRVGGVTLYRRRQNGHIEDHRLQGRIVHFRWPRAARGPSDPGN